MGELESARARAQVRGGRPARAGHRGHALQRPLLALTRAAGHHPAAAAAGEWGAGEVLRSRAGRAGRVLGVGREGRGGLKESEPATPQPPHTLPPRPIPTPLTPPPSWLGGAQVALRSSLASSEPATPREGDAPAPTPTYVDETLVSKVGTYRQLRTTGVYLYLFF
jgi:hypothetical protein